MTTGRLCTAFVGVAAAAVGLFAGFTKPKPPPPTAIASVTPGFGAAATVVTIGGTSLTKVTKVLFGDTSAGFTVKNGGTITATVPFGTPGSTVPVTGIAKGNPVPTSASFAYPVGDLSVTGPLPSYFDERGDAYWFNGGGHDLSIENPSSLVFGELSPLIHVTTSFDDDSSENPEGATGDDPQLGPFKNVGDGGSYSATLQRCDVNQQPSPDNACQNWDGNQGAWTSLPSVTGTLATPGSDRTAFGDLAVPTSGLFSDQQLANTFRLVGTVQQTDSQDQRAQASRFDSKTSTPFNAAVIPSALVQLSAVPYTIIYQPPGNESTVSFATKAGYGTDLTLSNSKEQTNSYRYESSSSTQFSLSAAIGLGYNLNDASSLDHTTEQEFGLTNDAKNQQSDSLALTDTYSQGPFATLIPGDGATCASANDCSNATLRHPTPADLYAGEPFWEDTFKLLVHPQVAAYVLGGGEARYVLTAAVPVLADATVRTLEACRLGQTPYGIDPCLVPYSDNGLNFQNGSSVAYTGQADAIELTRQDAANLLVLDPFYGAGQNANLFAGRAVPIASVSYGAWKLSEQPHTFSTTYDNTMAKTNAVATTTTASTSVTDVIGSTSGGGASLNADVPTGKEKNGGPDGSPNATYNVSVTLGAGEKTTSVDELKTSYSDSTAQSSTLETTATVTLGDADNTTPGMQSCQPNCHDPMPKQPSLNVYFDRQFGSFMFQDPRAPKPPLDLAAVAKYALDVANFEGADMIKRALEAPGFRDVPRNSSARLAINFLTNGGLMSALSDGRFHPTSPLTNLELATALGKAVKLTPARALELLLHASRSANGPVTENGLALALARAFRIGQTSARKLVTGALRPHALSAHATATRAQGALILFSALRAHCVERCVYHAARVAQYHE